MDPAVKSIKQNINEDWKVLQSVYDLLKNENVFCVSENEAKEKILDFVQPDELKKLIDLEIKNDAISNSEDVMEICRRVIKYSVKTNHTRFHNQLYGQMDSYGLMGSWITEALNTGAYTYEVAPVFSLIETEIVRKISNLCGYKNGDGIFAPGGSISNMYAMALARYKLYPNIKSTGMFGIKPLVLFTSEESHYSFKKAAHWLGIGVDNCIMVKTNPLGQISPDDLECKIMEAQAEGKEPFFVSATAGTTVLGAFDDFNQVATVCEKFNLWFHVDGCHGGTVLFAKENRHLMNGVERSNSFAWNPHKALGAPLQCALFITKETNLLSQCNSVQVNYLFQQDKYYDVSYDSGNKSIQCGRKVDAFKIWLMLKARGLSAMGALVDHAIRMSKLLVEKIKERGTDRFRLVQERYQYTNVCFWYIPKMLRNQKETPEWKEKLYKVAPKIKEQMVRSGTLMVGYSPLSYRNLGNFFRMVLTCHPVLQEPELDFFLDEIERSAEECIF